MKPNYLTKVHCWHIVVDHIVWTETIKTLLLNWHDDHSKWFAPLFIIASGLALCILVISEVLLIGFYVTERVAQHLFSTSSKRSARPWCFDHSTGTSLWCHFLVINGMLLPVARWLSRSLSADSTAILQTPYGRD